MKLTTQLNLIPRLRTEWSYTSSSPISLRGVDRENLLFIYVSELTLQCTVGMRMHLRELKI